MLEPYALKGARTVLRGGGEGDLTSLPDPQGSKVFQGFDPKVSMFSKAALEEPFRMAEGG
jgi:hypothetical protein